MTAGPDETGASFRRLQALFDDFVELEAGDRERQLVELDRRDPALAQELREWLAADAAAEGFLEDLTRDGLPTLISAAVDQAAEPGLGAGDRLGAWRVIGLLGRGGMGEVWEVERADGAYQQRAAAKVLRRGLDSETVLARFRSEQQILARLEHPAIAKIFDGGLAEDGRPFYVMEKVDGVPITEYCRELDVPIAELTRLLRTVCDAVDAAHRALVVHRDLKPSNVLVSRQGEPKLLDFGIAKLLDPQGEGAVTRLDDRALTPAYAAPEQILGEPITTATDVYALGVMFYELLTGVVPHQRGATSAGELFASVTRETTTRPSLALRRLAGEEARDPERAGRRLRWARRVRGDLDAIALKALEPEPARRYRSAAELGHDLDRYLAGLPVEARPASAGYRFSRFVRRHRTGVAAALLATLSLVVGLVVSLDQAARARHEAERAVRARDVLISILEGADPELAQGEEVSARELLEQSGRRIESAVQDDPELRDELLLAIARVEGSLGLLGAALPRAEQAWASTVGRAGADSEPATRAALGLANLLAAAGELVRAQELLQQALDVERRRSGPDSVEVARFEVALAGILEALGRGDEGISLLEHAVGTHVEHLGEDHDDTLGALNVLAVTLDSQDRIEESVALYRDIASRSEARFGSSDPRTLVAFHNLAMGLLWSGVHSEAQQWFERAIEGMRRVLGPDHHRLAFTLNQYSNLLTQIDRDDEADAATREAMDVFRRIRPDHPEVANGEHSLGLTALRRDDWASAERHISRALELWSESIGANHGSVGIAHAYRGLALAGLGRFEEARAEYQRALEILGVSGSGRLANALRAAGEIERRAGAPELALELNRRAQGLAIEVFGEGHPIELAAKLAVAQDLVELGTDPPSEIVARLEQVRETQRTLDPDSARIAIADSLEGQLALRAGNAKAALELFRAAERQLLVRRPPEHPRVREAQEWIQQAAALAGVGTAGDGPGAAGTDSAPRDR